MEKPKVTKSFLYSIMLAMLLTGTANTIVGKYIDLQIAPKVIYPANSPQNPENYPVCYPFLHPYLQTAVMFIGELSVYLALFAKLHFDKRAQQQEQLLSPGAAQAQKQHMKTNINPLKLAIPASCDLCASTLMFVALTMVSPSVY